MTMLSMNSNSIKKKEIKVIKNNIIKTKKLNSNTMNKVKMKVMLVINYNKNKCTIKKEKKDNKKDKMPNGVDLTTKMVLTTKVKN